MRILELSTVVGTFAYIVHQMSPQRDGHFWISALLFVCVLLLLLHFLSEGYRWQMLPIYVAVAACVFQERVPGWTEDVQLQYVAGVATLCLIGVGVLLSTVFPVFQLPAPTGPYAIGTDIRHLVDHDRGDALDSGRPRQLMVQVWYPAEKMSSGSVARYQERATTTAWDARFSLVRTHSIMRAPLARSSSRYPLLLYAPSWTGMRTENTHLAEELASHGYIVVGMDHPYGSLVTAYPDGRLVRTVLPEDNLYESEASFDRFLKIIESEIRVRAEDAKFVLSSFEKIDAADPEGLLTQHIDLAGVGIFGFSLGGGVAAQACWLERRFKACLNMDGVMAAESLQQGAGRPLFFMNEPDPPDPASAPNVSAAKRRELTADWEQLMQGKKLLSEFGGYRMTIARTKHFNFSDLAFSSPLRILANSGALMPTAAAGIVRQYTLAFFDEYLKGIHQKLLADVPPNDPRFRFEKWEGATLQPENR